MRLTGCPATSTDGCLQRAQILPFDAELVLATLMDSQLTAADAASGTTVRRFRCSSASKRTPYLPAWEHIPQPQPLVAPELQGSTERQGRQPTRPVSMDERGCTLASRRRHASMYLDWRLSRLLLVTPQTLAGPT